MDTLGTRLKAEREAAHLTQDQLADKAGVSQSLIVKIENNKSKESRKASKLADALGLNTDWLAMGTGEKYKTARAIESSQELQAVIFGDASIGEKKNGYANYPRVVGTARCGDNGYYMDLEGGDGYIEFDAEPGAIAIRIKGHSMHPAIREGWFVIIEPNKQPDIGEYVLAKYKDGKKMVKELLQVKSDGYLLLSVNGNERITASFEELEGVEAITAIVPPSKHKEW